MRPLVAIVGPTGIGKSRLAVSLAGIFHGEIVSADSRQVYRHMDIGTAKPSPDELARVPHHLIGIVDPDEDFSLAAYQELACDAIGKIHGRGRLPLLVGGSGLYIKAVLEGWQVPRVSPDQSFRYNIERRVNEEGVDAVYEELLRLDPSAAVRIDRRNVRRVIRALEIIASGTNLNSGKPRKKPPPYQTLIIGLTAERSVLYRIVDRRVDDMIEAGLVREVENLLEMGYDLNLPSMSGIGYRQIGQYLRSEIHLAAAVSKIKTETHRFIRHQYAWFRLNDKAIRWFDVGSGFDTGVIKTVSDFLAK